MLKIGLTGGIATGKSYVLHRFASFGVPTIEADLLARQAVSAGTAGLRSVVERFGDSVRAADGTLDRRRVAELVFSDPAARADLERIIHPEVYRLIGEWAREVAADGAPFAIADIPLLYETGREGDFDRVVVTACSRDEQLRRLTARDGVTEEQARQRIAAQWPIDEKVARADFVIRTDGTFDDTDRQVDACLAWLTREAAAASQD